ncbi:hypothetical protein D0T49_05330 [Paludibacter sp. 221]|nr:hypothetical protein [Paludibacter sp. 221]
MADVKIFNHNALLLDRFIATFALKPNILKKKPTCQRTFKLRNQSRTTNNEPLIVDTCSFIRKHRHFLCINCKNLQSAFVKKNNALAFIASFLFQHTRCKYNSYCTITQIFSEKQMQNNKSKFIMVPI